MNPEITKRTDWKLDPVLMMFVALAIAVVLTWVVPSGKFSREPSGLVKPGTYALVAKEISPAALLPRATEGAKLQPASPASMVTAIPAGMVKAASLIFMITALGGMFGVLRATGTIEVAVDRLLVFTGGKTMLLTTVLMIAISAGSTFLGLISEYLLIIPLFLALSKRLGLQPMFGFALVTVAAKIGYIASVANPVILMVAQPIAGLPIFSGFMFRLGLWVVFMAVGIFYVMRLARESAVPMGPIQVTALSRRHTSIIGILGAAVFTLVYCAAERDWRDPEFAAFYLFMALLIAAVGGLAPRRAVQCLVEGMRSMMLAGFLVGMAKGVEVILQNGQILDTIVNLLASWAAHLPRAMIAMSLVFIEMLLGLLIPSGSAKAAISMPILVPVAHVAGISGQTTVLAYLMGNGLINMFAPTSGMLLAYLATADIPYGKWLRYSLPLFLGLTVLALLAVYIAVAIGY